MLQRALLALSLVASMSLTMAGLAFSQGQDEKADVYRQTQLFGEIFERVRDQYVDEISDKDLMEAAINGMLQSLDPHSSYIPSQAAEEMRIETEGQFGGLGIEVTMERGWVKVVAPLRDTPASKAGLESNDFITHLDDQAVQGLTLSEAVDIMRGLVGTKIKLTIFRESLDEPFDVELTRAIIPLRTVRARTEADDTIVYFWVSQFSGTTYDSMLEEIKLLQDEHGDKITGYIMDLRNNPGGLLTQAIQISDAFLDKGEIVSTRGRDPQDVRRVTAQAGDVIDGKPLVVLVNGGSASASEIVAGALKDHRRAVIMGTTTFGKGSVQTLFEMPGAGVMKLTTQRYYTPAGTSIQATGVEPDILVEQSRIEAIDNGRRQRREADLRGSLDNPQEGEEAPAEESGEETGDAIDEETPADTENEAAVEEEEAAPQDYQLLRAIDLLTGIALFNR